MRQRKNVDTVCQSDVERLRSAFRQLQNEQDARINYAHYAAIHAQSCPHGCRLFLPWHRAFIFEFENALRRYEPDVTLPYWDWVGTPDIPACFAEPADGSNPLFFADRFTPQERASVGIALPTQHDVDGVNTAPSFSVFGGSAGSGGALESKHGWVHCWVGRSMSMAACAAYDPIFWIHHGNVDRLWASWQDTHAGHDPRNPTDALAGFDHPWTVQDVLHIDGQKLGYEYVDRVLVLDQLGQERFTEDLRLASLPDRFASAELRLEDVYSQGANFCFFDVFIGEARAARIPLFGVPSREKGHHAMPAMPGMPKEAAIHLDITETLRLVARDNRNRGAFAIKLRAPCGEKEPTGLHFARVVLAFTL